MKFRLLSDLHLEFGGMAVPVLPDDHKTVLILAGDIHVGCRARPWIEKLTKRFKAVVYVMGNHEYYHGDVVEIDRRWSTTPRPDNLHILQASSVTIGRVRILGGTLWTDFRRKDPLVMETCRTGLNDYDLITFDGEKFQPRHAAALHDETVEWMKKRLARPFKGKTLVVTHHAPHLISTEIGRYRGSPINPAYSSDLTHIFDEYNIDIWCHGHTHAARDYIVPGTNSRVICNPRGYAGYELNDGFNPSLTFEL